MSNIIEYVDQMKNIPFEESEFNEVDGLVLAQLSYLNYGVINNQVNQAFFQLTDIEIMHKMVKDTWNSKANLELLEKVNTSLRFSSIQIINHKNITSEEKQEQFSATTFKLNEHFYYISFRGTDATILGWRENFSMSYQDVISSQITAIQYFEEVFTLNPGYYYLGGHSKGGNLATFSGAFANKQLQGKIIAIYNFDGPGFHQSVIESAGYQNVINKLFKIVPKSAIVGILLEETNHFKIVKSNTIGVLQHDPFTWKVTGNKFIIEDSISSFSYLTQKTILSWTSSMNAETKKKCLDALYEIILSTGASRFTQLRHINIENVKRVFISIKNTDKEIKREWFLITKLFLKISVDEAVHLVTNIK